jgi:arsenite-transporting ATPase
VFASLRRFYDRLDGVKELLTDPEISSMRLVVNPERMVIAEARRTFTYLSLFGYRVDAVVANRLLPDEVTDPWFARWRALHAEHLATIEDGFAPVPVLKARLAGDELVGLDALRGFATEVYGDDDPSARRHKGEPMSVAKVRGRYVLKLELPFADRDELDLGRRGDELVITVGPYRRSVLLPDSLRRRSVEGASLKGGTLKVTFGEATS